MSIVYYYYYYYYYYYVPHQQFLAFLTITVRPATFWWKIETCVSLNTESTLGECTVKNILMHHIVDGFDISFTLNRRLSTSRDVIYLIRSLIILVQCNSRRVV